MEGTIKPIIEATQVASPAEVLESKKLLRSTVGFAGYMTRMEMRSRLTSSSALRESLTQTYNLSKETLYIKSTDLKSGRFVAVGHSLAKQATIEPRQYSRAIKLKRKLKNVDGSLKAGTRGRSYYAVSAGTAKSYSDIANFKTVTVYQKKLHTKGKNAGKEYWSKKKLQVFQGWTSDDEFPSYITYKLKNGEWRRARQVQIATRPESLHWKNWIQNYGLEGLSAPRCTQAISNYLQSRLEEMTKD